MNKGSKLWKKALDLIPGGNGLLSKRPERFHPEQWPTYYKSAKGCKVVTLDNKTYYDFTQMGVGSCIFGYNYEPLNREVIKSIKKSVNTTLNCPEEVELAKLLLKSDKFAGSVKFARSGGEAMGIAVRIARAASGRDKVAFSGYHGWKDWYLASNIKNKKALDKQLLPGLSVIGVPGSLKNTSIPFLYNSIESFHDVIKKNDDIGVICIEGARGEYPNRKFISEITKIARRKKIILICDEITSGWRMANGGSYKVTGIKPDIVVYGKGMGGGFAISAVVGKKKIMDFAQNTFISSSMWTERVGFVAGLNSIKIFKQLKLWKKINKIGFKIKKNWQIIAKKTGINIKVNEVNALISFKFLYGDKNLLIETIFISKMLEYGFLASTSVYPCLAHTDIILNKYFKNVEKTFRFLYEEIHYRDFKDFNKTKIRSDAFKRLSN